MLRKMLHNLKLNWLNLITELDYEFPGTPTRFLIDGKKIYPGGSLKKQGTFLTDSDFDYILNRINQRFNYYKTQPDFKLKLKIKELQNLKKNFKEELYNIHPLKSNICTLTLLEYMANLNKNGVFEKQTIPVNEYNFDNLKFYLLEVSKNKQKAYFKYELKLSEEQYQSIKKVPISKLSRKRKADRINRLSRTRHYKSYRDDDELLDLYFIYYTMYNPETNQIDHNYSVALEKENLKIDIEEKDRMSQISISNQETRESLDKNDFSSSSSYDSSSSSSYD